MVQKVLGSNSACRNCKALSVNRAVSRYLFKPGNDRAAPKSAFHMLRLASTRQQGHLPLHVTKRGKCFS